MLASKINFLNLYGVNRNKHKFLPVMLTVLSVTAASSVLSDEFSRAYSASFNQNKNVSHIFKLTDNNGKITYSSSKNTAKRTLR